MVIPVVISPVRRAHVAGCTDNFDGLIMLVAYVVAARLTHWSRNTYEQMVSYSPSHPWSAVKH
jgi:hypothetical protein